MDKITFTTPLSDDEADEYDRRMEALFGGGAEEPERFESVGVSDYVVVAAEGDRTVVKSAYNTLMQIPSFRKMDAESKEQFREKMNLEATWEYIEALKSIIEYKDKENDKLRRELSDAKKEITVQMSTDKRLTSEMNIEGVMKTDVELRSTPTGVSLARFTLGINRGGKEDFINCTAWRNAADYIVKYFNKGDRVIVTGITDGLRVGNIRKKGGTE